MNFKNVFFLSVIAFLAIIIFLFDPIIFGAKLFGSPDSLSPRSVAMALNKASEGIGGYPLWQPWVFSGMPTAESFSYLSKLYFPEYIFKIFSLSGSTIQFIHLIFSGLGCMILLRELMCSKTGSFLGAVAYMTTPFMITMAVYGHGSQLMTAAYIPWALWLSIRSWNMPSLKNAGSLALILGFQLQRAHAQIAYYTWLLIGLYFLIMLIQSIREKNEKLILSKKLLFILIACMLGIGISALIYIPAIEYTPFSVRGGSSSGGSDYNYATGWSFHPFEILTFFIPSSFGFGGQMYWGYMPFTDYPNYMGIVVLCLALIGMVYKKGLFKWYLLTVTILALFISFGRHFNIIYNLFFNFFPYFDKFRVPHMILILVQFSVAIFAAFGIDKILQTQSRYTPKWFYYAMAPFIVFFISLVFGSNTIKQFLMERFSMPRTNDPSQIQAINAIRWDLWISDAWLMIFFTSLFFTLLWMWYNNKVSKKIFSFCLIAIALVDILIVDKKIIEPDRSSGRASQLISKRFVKEYYRKDQIVSHLSSDNEKFRIYPAGQLFGDSRFAAFGLESVGGYHPAKLDIYNDFLKNTQNAGILPVLRMLNTKYLILPEAQRISHPDLSFEKRGALRTSRGDLPTVIYKINNYLPRAWFVNKVEKVKDSEIWQNISSENYNPEEKVFTFEETNITPKNLGEIKSIDHSIHKITITTESSEDQFLVLSEVFYPIRWKAFIDNNPIKTFQVNGILRGVIVPKGDRVIQFIYDKSSFNFGFSISLLSFVVSIGLIGFGFRRKKENEKISK